MVSIHDHVKDKKTFGWVEARIVAQETWPGAVGYVLGSVIHLVLTNSRLIAATLPTQSLSSPFAGMRGRSIAFPPCTATYSSSMLPTVPFWIRTGCGSEQWVRAWGADSRFSGFVFQIRLLVYVTHFFMLFLVVIPVS